MRILILSRILSFLKIIFCYFQIWQVFVSDLDWLVVFKVRYEFAPGDVQLVVYDASLVFILLLLLINLISLNFDKDLIKR